MWEAPLTPISYQNWQNINYQKQNVGFFQKIVASNIYPEEDLWSTHHRYFYCIIISRQPETECKYFERDRVASQCRHFGRDQDVRKSSEMCLANAIHNSEKFIQPIRDNSCAMLLLTNLAEPHWVSIQCDHKILSHVVCAGRLNMSTATTHNSSFTQPVCRKSSLFIDGGCFYFFSFTYKPHTGLSHSILRCPLSEMHLLHGHNLSDFKKFYPLVRATSKPHFNLISFDPFHVPTMFLYKRTWFTETFTVESLQNEINEGLSACASAPHFLGLKNELMFFCQSGFIISTIFVCDGNNDCRDLPGIASSDELDCTCKKKSEHFCKESCQNNSCKCSPLFVKSYDEKCHSIKGEMTESLGSKDIQHLCDDGSVISSDLVDDLIPDCGT